jgi:hypothetical protein
MSEYSFDNHGPLRIFHRIYHLGPKITLFAITKVIFQSDLVNERIPLQPGYELGSREYLSAVKLLMSNLI